LDAELAEATEVGDTVGEGEGEEEEEPDSEMEGEAEGEGKGVREDDGERVEESEVEKEMEGEAEDVAVGSEQEVEPADEKVPTGHAVHVSSPSHVMSSKLERPSKWLAGQSMQVAEK